MKPQTREFPVLTDNLYLNRKIHLIYENALHHNWMAGGEYPGLPHAWIMSGGERRRHLWLADACLATVANALFRPEESKDLYRNFWHWMERNPRCHQGTPRHGMIPAGVLTDHGAYYSTYCYSQTPIIAWTIWVIYCQDGDKEFLRQSLPYLVRFHDWFDRERDIDADRLIEIGSYGQEERQPRMETIDLKQELDEQAILNEAGGYWAHWGRGKAGIRMSVDRLLVTNRQKELMGDRFYANVELVESTAGMVLMEKSLAGIARVLGEETVEAKMRALASAREDALNAEMWDPDDGFYYDLKRDTHEKIMTRGWGQFFPLISRSASERQAVEMVKRLEDPNEFWTTFPASLHAKGDLTDPSSDVRDTSVAINFLLAVGLNNYGFHGLAKKLTDSTIEMLDERRCHQRYLSASGEPLGGGYECLAALAIPMIFQNLYGIQVDGSTIRLADRMMGRWVRCGKLWVDCSQAGEVKLGSEFDRQVYVRLPGSWTGASGEIALFREGSEGVRRRELPASMDRASGELAFRARADEVYVISLSKGSK